MSDISGYGLLAICMAAALLLGSTLSGGDCYTDWDGRSNTAVCD